MNVLSLFAGVGCFDLAAERVGMAVVGHCEIDPAARAVLRNHFPTARTYDDVRTLTGDRLRADGALPDLILAGFPCQDLSVAGRRAGLGGGRSGLFFEITRLLAETGARWVVLENVPGLLSSVCPCPGDGACERRDEADNPYGTIPVVCPGEQHNVPGGACVGGCVDNHGGAMGAVLGTLGELRYGLAYRVLDAQYFGVPQRRRRVFIVGHLGDGAAPAQVLLEPEGSDGDLAPSLTARPGAAPSVAAGAGSGRVASFLTAREGKGPDSDATTTLVETVSTLQGGGFADIGWTRSQPPAGISSRRGLVSALTASGVGTCGADDNQAQAGHLIPQAYTVHSEHSTAMTGDGDAAVAFPTDVVRTIDTTGGYASSQGGTVVAQAWPIAVRGREGGSQAEVGEEGLANTLRAGDGGSSRSSLIADTLTAEGADASEDGTGRGTPLVPWTAVPIDLRNALRDNGETGVGTPGTGVGEEGDPAGTVSTGALQAVATYRKSTRAASTEHDKTNTLNTFDNGDTRAVDLVLGVGLHGEVSGGTDDLAPAMTTSNGQPTGVSGLAVRRLTPRECERLQGLPDDWTATGLTEDGKPIKNADSARYRFCGNGGAVPVMEWILRRLALSDHLAAEQPAAKQLGGNAPSRPDGGGKQ